MWYEGVKATIRRRLWSWSCVPAASSTPARVKSDGYELKASAPASHSSSSVRFFVRVSHIIFFQQMHKNSLVKGFLTCEVCAKKLLTSVYESYKRAKSEKVYHKYSIVDVRMRSISVQTLYWKALLSPHFTGTKRRELFLHGLKIV